MAFAQQEQLKTAQEKEEMKELLRLKTVAALMWIDAIDAGSACFYRTKASTNSPRRPQSWLARRCVRILFCYWTWQDTLSQKLLDMAVKIWDGAQKDWDGAQKDLDGAREDLDFARQGLRQAVQNGDEKERKEAREEFKKAKEEFEKAKEEAKRAESKVQTAKEEATKAREELEEAKSTAPLQASGAQLLLFVRSTVFAFWGHALLSALR